MSKGRRVRTIISPTDKNSNPSSWRLFAEALLDLLLPRRCVGCGKFGTWLCAACKASMPTVRPPICGVCGASTKGLAICASCWNRRHHVRSIRTPYYFEGTVRQVVHRLKYRGGTHLAEPLGELLADFAESELLLKPQVIVAVPLHPQRLRERGYNQALLIARVLSERMSLPVLNDCVERIKDTPPQMSLPANQRQQNMRDVFRANRDHKLPTSLLLIDDVCTTGATLQSCAAALKKAGAQEIWALAVARTRLPSERQRAQSDHSSEQRLS